MGNQLNSTAVQTETKVYNETTTRKISDIDKQGAQLLTQIQVFKNKGDGMDFESWIRHFENTLDIGDFEESRKIKYLVSKLMGLAGDFVEQYRLDHPVEASCHKTLKRALKDRFMGKNIEYKYQTSYDNCKSEEGESVRAFACRVQKLLRKGYPALVEGKSQETIEQFSRHKFVDGLSVDLQDRLLCLEFTSFDQLIEAAERHDTALEQRDARKKREMINAMNILPQTSPPTQTRQSDQLIMDSLKKLNEKLDKTAEQQEELRVSFEKLKTRSSPRNVRFEDRPRKYCEIHKYGSHTTEECSLRGNANEIICFRCGNPGHRAYECPKTYQKGSQQQNWRQQPAEPPANTTAGVNGASQGSSN